jgi:hypothetical protein
MQSSEHALISRDELVDQLRALPKAQQDVMKLDDDQKYISLSQDSKQKLREIREEQDSEKANAKQFKGEITALNKDAQTHGATIEMQYMQKRQQKTNMAKEQEQLNVEKEDAAVRGQ